MICEKCWRDIPDGSRFCTYCGAQIELRLPEELEAPKETEAFYEAGALLDSYAPPTNQYPPIGQYPAGEQYSPVAGTYPPALDPYASSTPLQGGASFGAPTNMPSPMTQYSAPSYTAGGPGPGQIPLPPSGPQPSFQPMYGGVPQQPPKKKAGAKIIIIVAVALVCIGIGIAAFFAINNMGGTTGGPTGGTTGGTTGGGTTNGGTGGGTTAPTPFKKELIDCNDCRITLGPVTYDKDLDWIEVEVVVENKTNKTLFIYFDYDTTIDGFDNKTQIGPLLMSDDEEAGYDFPPKKATSGTLLFTDVPKSKKIENFKGTIIVVDGDTFDTMGKYPFSIKSVS